MRGSKQYRVHVDLGEGWKEYIDKPPAGHKPLGVVRCGTAEPGALAVIESSGDYVQLNTRGMTTLDQRKVRAALGLSNPMGRPMKGYERRELHSVRIEPSLVTYLMELGGGNLSDGIAKVATEHRERGDRRRAGTLVDVQTEK